MGGGGGGRREINASVSSSLVVSMFDFRSGGRWFKPSLCRHVVLFHIVSLHPGV